MFKIILLVVSLVVSIPVASLACMNAVSHEKVLAVRQVVRAEKLLAQGRTKAAIRVVGWKTSIAVPPRVLKNEHLLEVRLERIRRVAAFRLKDAARYGGNIEDGIEAFENAIMRKTDEDPVLLARLAEGYLFDESKREKALTILLDLEARDLMPDAYAFRTLARLHADKGDRDAAKQALGECRTLTQAKRICRAKRLVTASSTRRRIISRPKSLSRKRRVLFGGDRFRGEP